MRGFRGFVGWNGALALMLGLALGAGPVRAETPAPAPAAPVATQPSSADQLKAAIEEIKQRLAKQKAAEGQPSATAGLTDELKAASQRLQNLTQAMEALRAERDQLRADLATAHGQLDQMSQELVAGKSQQRAQASQDEASLAAANAAKAKLTADLATAEKRSSDLEARLEATDQAKGKAEAALAAAGAELQQTAKGADAQLAEARAALEKSRQDLGAAVAKATASEAEIKTLQGKLADAAGAADAKGQDVERLSAALAAEKTARADAERTLAQERTRAGGLEAQATTLQAAAGSSVEEVKSLGDQLLQALAQNQDLTTGLAEMRVTKEVLDKELASARRDAGAASKEAGDLRAELAKARQGLIGLAAPEPAGDASAEAAAPAPAAGSDQLSSLQLKVADPGPAAAASGALPETMLAAVRELNGSVKEDGWVMVVPAGLDFRPGTSDLTPSGVAALGKVASLIEGLPAGRVRIAGHTDSGGNADDNLRLSLQRAQSVRDQLVGEYRLAPQVIQTEGYGEQRPITSNDTAEGRKANRRVEIYLHR